MVELVPETRASGKELSGFRILILPLLRVVRQYYEAKPADKFCQPMASIYSIDVRIRIMKEIMIPDCVKVGLFGQVRPVGEVV